MYKKGRKSEKQTKICIFLAYLSRNKKTNKQISEALVLVRGVKL